MVVDLSLHSMEKKTHHLGPSTGSLVDPSGTQLKILCRAVQINGSHSGNVPYTAPFKLKLLIQITNPPTFVQ